MRELSAGKDTTIGHWEIAGLVSGQPLPTYPDGFPDEVVAAFEKATGRRVICNKPYSGTDVIRDYGEEHVKTGALIVYTSADSVFQIAAHEDIVPIEELYRYCEIARELLVEPHGVGRVIARPFEGEHPFRRTPRRHDYSLLPPAPTMLDVIKENGLDVISVGKIADIFAGQGVTEGHRTGNNDEGMKIALSMTERDFHGLCFVNLVDFDMTFGHRNDVDGYAAALTKFDAWLADFLPRLGEEDALIITADHGCDPSTPSTDHSREHTPMLLVGCGVKAGVDLGTRVGFCDIAATVLEALGVEQGSVAGKSFWGEVVKEG
jgi:phosphopentomutase